MSEQRRFDASWWLLRALGGYFGVAVIYGLIGALFGWHVAMGCALLFLAFAIGLFYGAGREILKREADPKGDAQPPSESPHK
jgi:hypothetical protein